MQPTQTPLFTPNPFAGQPRPKVVRKDAQDRYEQALVYLRLELKSGKYEALSCTEFANTFKISKTFLHALADMGGVHKKRANKQNYYRALPKLETITAKEILRHKVDMYKLEPETPVTVEPEPATENVAASVQVAESPEDDTRLMYLIGIVENGTITIPVDSKIEVSSVQEAHDLLINFNCKPGQKLALLEVVEVIQPKQVFESATL